MSHLDEGRLTLLLDGELTPKERAEAERHLAACPECRRLHAELRDLAGEAARLVATVEPAPRPAPVLPARRRPGWERWRPLAWAATVVLAAGLGWFSSGARLRSEADTALQALQQPAARRADPGTADTTAPAASALRSTPAPAAPPARAADTARDESRAEAPGEARVERSLQPRGQAAATALSDAAAAGAAVPDHRTETQQMAKSNAAEATESAPAPAAVPQVSPRANPTGLVPRDEVTSRQRMAPVSERPVAMDGFQSTSLEAAVQVLGGVVRLLDGFTPAAVRIGAGRLVTGADPAHPMVRIVYLDPPGRELWLDQQRIGAPEAGPRAGPSRLELLPGDTVVMPAAEGLVRVRWLDQDGFHLALTGRLSGDSLRVLARRVR